MIKVLHVLSDTNIGGAGINMAGLVKTMDRGKFRAMVACPVGARIREKLDSSIPVIEVTSMAGDKSFHTGSISELVNIIKQNQIDIVHTHGSLSGRIAGKIAGVKIVFTRHTPGIVHPFGSLKWTINKYSNLMLCDKIIAVSDYIAAQLEAAGLPKNRIATIYNGIDISSYTGPYNIAGLREELGLTGGHLLLHIARLEEVKGHKYLFEALALLDRKKYDAQLIVVGDGSQQEKLRRLTEVYNITDRVVFTGAVNDVRPLIAISDIVLLPSLAEALGIVLLEGMSMGKPCIASRVGGIPEVVADGRSGILVPPRNTTALLNAMVKLLENPALAAEMGQTGRQAVIDKFDLYLKVREVEKIYFELMDQIPEKGQ